MHISRTAKLIGDFFYNRQHAGRCSVRIPYLNVYLFAMIWRQIEMETGKEIERDGDRERD
jgi:hypothetical protein